MLLISRPGLLPWCLSRLAWSGLMPTHHSPFVSMEQRVAASRRAESLLGKAGLHAPARVPNLQKPPPLELDIQSQLPGNLDAARALLRRQRDNSKRDSGGQPFRYPSTRTKNFWRSENWKSAADDEAGRTFSKHVVSSTLHAILSNEMLVPSGVAQAVLSHATPVSLEELWRHSQDPSLEKRERRRFSVRGSVCLDGPSIMWLDTVTRRGNIDYIRLMCCAEVGQDTLARAFDVALSTGSMEVMKLLLSFGAVASASQDAIRDRVRLRDLALVGLLLSAPESMSVDSWRYCMEPELESPESRGGFGSTLLLQCLANRNDVACGSMLLKAMSSGNFEAAAIILAYIDSHEELHDIRERLCELASRFQAHERRHAFYTLLAESRLIINIPVTREELLKDVKAHHLALVKVLVGTGVGSDIEPHNAVAWAVSRLDFAVLELLTHGILSSPISTALAFVPDSTSEPDMLQLMSILGPMNVIGEELDGQLVRAVRKGHAWLVETLIQYGASAEFDQAQAIRIALEDVKLEILRVLLRSQCAQGLLSSMIPTAMAITPRRHRLLAMKALVKKGIQSEDLHGPLHDLVSESGEIDSDLVRVLIDHHAPIDPANEGESSPVSVVAGRGDLSILKILCDAGPQPSTLAHAVPIAFGLISTHEYGLVLSMVGLLLQGRATGPAIDQTLLDAASRDSRLDIVSSLLVFGAANPNYKNGASLVVAIETGNHPLLEMLCKASTIDQESLVSVMPVALNPRFYELQSLNVLLRSASPSSIWFAVSHCVGELKGHPNVSDIFSCFTRHRLDINYGNGILVCLTVKTKDINLLKTVLLAKLTVGSAKSAFHHTAKLQPRAVQLEMMRLLLEKASSAEVGQSERLPQETQEALSGDQAGLKLLVSHSPSVDFNQGEALKLAATTGSLEVLHILLSPGTAARETLDSVFTAVLPSNMSLDKKQGVLERILTTEVGVSADRISTGLVVLVERHPDCTLLARLLLAHGANLNLKILITALATSSQDLFCLLLSNTPNTQTIKTVFAHAQKMVLDPGRKYWIYQSLLDKGISKDEASEALIESITTDPNDLAVIELLIDHGAAVGYRDAAAFSTATGSNSAETIKLLGQHIADGRTSNLAFDLISMANGLEPQARLDIYSLLLQWDINKNSLFNALQAAINAGRAEEPAVHLLLSAGADPNEGDGRCFLLAARPDRETIFRILCKHADMPMVLPKILAHFSQEVDVVRWFRACLDEQPILVEPDQNDLLFQSMRKFPRGASLVKILLDHGLSAAAATYYSVCPQWAAEPCSALLWALFTQPRVDNQVILQFLARGEEGLYQAQNDNSLCSVVLMDGNKTALPMYDTPNTNVSAAFGCLVDKTRTPILKKLIKFGGSSLLRQTVSPSTFRDLVSSSEPPSVLWGDEITPCDAALWLGNWDAFRLLHSEDFHQEEMLHLAAVLALPKFVQWLLETHNADEEGYYNGLIPLVVACQSRPFRWCKVAEEESSWAMRRKQTMQLLAAKTDLSWRDSRKRTPLHFALESGPEATEVMLEVLDARDDPLRDERYMYEDVHGTTYSPCQWVSRTLELGEEEKKKLVKCLEGHGLRPRYFNKATPGNGSQPEGACGLPTELKRIWRTYGEAIRQKLLAEQSDAAAKERIHHLERQRKEERERQLIHEQKLKAEHKQQLDLARQREEQLRAQIAALELQQRTEAEEAMRRREKDQRALAAALEKQRKAEAQLKQAQSYRAV